MQYKFRGFKLTKYYFVGPPSRSNTPNYGMLKYHHNFLWHENIDSIEPYFPVTLLESSFKTLNLSFFYMHVRYVLCHIDYRIWQIMI